ncbi:MAG TPA: TonB-dependent receptor [Gemmatimonadaceae bacterium]|nr:TonB-dependent receptor [Gemmatimonadaceae bacterium]
MSVIRLARLAAFTSLLLAGIVSSGAAQASTTTGNIRGRVIDEAGNPLPAATVVATNEETGFQRGTQTGDDGVFVVRFLPPGSYRVAARRIGQQASELPGIRVTVGSTAPANFTLRTAAVQLTGVEVTANAREIDVADAGVKQTVSQEEIAELPSLGRDFTDFIALSGLVSPAPEVTTGGQFAIAGQRPSQTSIQIDGVDANNAFFGENRGGSRIPFAFSLESIREFQIITNGFDVEFGNYSGGVINIVTQGGTNDFRASLYGNYRDKSLTREDFDGNAPNNFSVQQYAGKLSGPIVRDQLHYLVSVDGQRRREPFRSITPAFLRGTGNAADAASADSLERFFDVLESEYGVAGAASQYGEWEISNDVLTIFGRVDWTLNDRHRLSVRNNFSDHKNLDEAGSFAFPAGRSQAESFKDRANSLVGELTSVITPSIFNVLRVQYATEERPRIGNNLKPELRVRLDANETVEYGGAFISFRNFLDETKFQVVDNVTLALGDHSIKLGTNNTFTSIENIFWLNGSGGFEFNSLADFEAFRPSRFNRNVRADSVTPNATFDVQEYSLYAQDEWRITPKLLGVFGVRYDIQRYGDRPGRVVDAERAFGLETGIAPIDDNNVSPRVSFTYDVKGDATQLIRLGAGLFYGRVPFVMGSNVASTDTPLLVVECRGSLAEVPTPPDVPPDVSAYPTWAASGEDNPFGCGGVGGIGGVPEYAFWNSGFEIPETLKANIGYERQLRPGTLASIDLLFSESSKLYTVRNINLRDPQFELAGEGGRRIFVPAGRFAPSSAAGTDRFRNADFASVYVNYNDGIARAFAASLNIDHRLSDSAAVRASYTYTRAYDNSTYSCCTANEGFTGQRYGALGPNVIGGIGDESTGWGPSNFNREHTIVLSGTFRLPFGLRVSPKWSIRSGTPWGPEVSGDINADGVSFNDRPYIFRPEELPVFVPSTASPEEALSLVATARARYSDFLEKHDCVGDYVGQIIPRNTCRQPWFNQLDMTVRKRFETAGDQAAEVHIDLFNVLNGLNGDWGRNVSVTAARRNLLLAQDYDASNSQVRYTVPNTFASRTQVGSNLLLQFSAQIGVRYYF